MPTFEAFDDEHRCATHGADKRGLMFVHVVGRDRRRCTVQQFARYRERVGALMIGEEPVVPNAMEAVRMHVQ